MKHLPAVCIIGLLIVSVAGAAAYVDLSRRLDALAAQPRASGAEPGLDERARPPAAAREQAAPREALWDCDGSIDGAALTRVVGTHGRSVFECRDRAQREGGPVAGLLDVHLRVAPDGHVAAARLGGTITHPELTRCVANAALRWTFEPVEARECAEVVIPFAFAPDVEPAP